MDRTATAPQHRPRLDGGRAVEPALLVFFDGRLRRRHWWLTPLATLGVMMLTLVIAGRWAIFGDGPSATHPNPARLAAMLFD